MLFHFESADLLQRLSKYALHVIQFLFSPEASRSRQLPPHIFCYYNLFSTIFNLACSYSSRLISPFMYRFSFICSIISRISSLLACSNIPSPPWDNYMISMFFLCVARPRSRIKQSVWESCCSDALRQLRLLWVCSPLAVMGRTVPLTDTGRGWPS